MARRVVLGAPAEGWNPTRAEEIVATLAGAGFHLVGIDPERVDDESGRTSWANVMFRRA